MRREALQKNWGEERGVCEGSGGDGDRKRARIGSRIEAVPEGF